MTISPATTSSATSIDWIVFDLGQVVLARTNRLPDLAALLHLDVETLIVGYQRHRLEYDRHSDASVFWTGVAENAGVPAPGPRLLDELVRIDEDGWSSTIPETLVLIDDLAAAGYGLAVCSNAPSSMAEKIRAQPWVAPFQHLVFSGDLGVVKPAAEIFDVVLAATGGTAERTLFFDDLAVNVAGAKAVGWQAIQFIDAASARDDLAALNVRR